VLHLPGNSPAIPRRLFRFASCCDWRRTLVTALFCSCVRFLTGACVVADLKDDPALDEFDAAVDRIEKLHDSARF
jgi:hypothetical protein